MATEKESLRGSRDADTMRIISSFFVVMLHAASANTAADVYSCEFIVPCFFNAISRFSVPVFVMISGRFMLAKEPDIRWCIKKAFRTVILLLLWGTAYWIYGLFAKGFESVSFQSAVIQILTQPVHLWFFYAITALYLFTPILAVFAQNSSKRQIEYALVLTFIFGSIITILLRTAHAKLLAIIIEKMKIGYTLGFVWCYLLGYYIYHFDIQIKLRYLYITGVICTAATFLGTVFLSQLAGCPNDFLLSFFAPNVLLSSAVFFWAVKQRGCKSENTRTRIFAECTGGVYGVHMLFLDILPWNIVPDIFCGSLRITAITALTYALSLMSAYLLRRLTFLRKYI